MRRGERDCGLEQSPLCSRNGGGLAGPLRVWAIGQQRSDRAQRYGAAALSQQESRALAQLALDRGLALELYMDEAGLPNIQLVLVHRVERRTTAGQFNPVASGLLEMEI